MAFCLHCGRRLEDDAAQCAGCGSPVTPGQAADPLSVAESHARDGRTIEAIKAYREATGASLSQAKEAVDEWSRSENWPAPSTHEALSPEVRELARQGRKIHAIKVYREETGASLKQAKEAVEAWLADHAPASGRASRGGCASSLLVFVLLLAGLLTL